MRPCNRQKFQVRKIRVNNLLYLQSPEWYTTKLTYQNNLRMRLCLNMADSLKKRFKKFFKKGQKVTYLEAARALNTSREYVYTMSSCYLEFLEEGTGTM